MAYLICLPLALSAPALRPSSLDVLLPNIAFILIYSVQPHKEWRFIVYSIPPLTVVCARGASYIWDRRLKSLATATLSALLIASTFLALAYSIASLLISSLNYPGAVALNRLHAFHGRSFLQKPPTKASVHMDVFTCQTGATLFLQRPPPTRSSRGDSDTRWTYDKTDSKTGDGSAVLRPEFWAQFDYALAERPEKVIGKWEVLDTVYGYGGIRLIRPGESWGMESEAEGPWNPSRDITGTDEGPAKWGEGPWAGFGRRLRIEWVRVGEWAQTWVTRGWWVDVKMVPMIRVLRREGDIPAGGSSSAVRSGRSATS